MTLSSYSAELVEELCERFDRNIVDKTKFSVDDARDLLLKLFGRFENPPYIYFSVNTGWFKLLADLHAKLFYIDPNYTIFQIKEKFGTLRFYVTFSNISPIAEEICFDLISYAENKSSNICEICGGFGSRNEDKHWLSVRCAQHRSVIFDF